MAETINKPPIAFYTLCNRKPSGWIQEGTQGTPFQIELDAPLRYNIPNTGWRKRKVVETDADGKVIGEYWTTEKIRYIKNCDIISVDEQERRGIKPSQRPMDDWISFLKGELSVMREKSFIGMFDYLEAVSYNMSNDDRLMEAQEVFKRLDLAKDAEEAIDFDELQDMAKRKARSWREKVDNTFIYNEEKIQVACDAFGVQAETLEQKLRMLIARASQDPKGFLDKLSKMEQTSLTEVHQALQLKLIEFVGNTAMYKDKENAAICNLGSTKLHPEKRIQKLADWFLTNEGKKAYEVFQVELDAAKEKQLTNA